jgi:prolyl 3-hydroxylase /prolyl 3,4-dihydroxylase
MADGISFQCYMAPHNEEDDPAIYRSGSSTKPQSSHNGASSSQNGSNGHSAGPSGNGTHKHDEDSEEMDDEDEEQEDDSTLLTVQPCFNSLLLVLRDERVMRFVKYVSAAATGSRWDICGEYEVGVLQEDDDDEEDET